ncbi:MAG: serine hydrolase [Candidatus Microthrix sp.]|nr:serine hydrolase [Candidatus Microthrix sp.]
MAYGRNFRGHQSDDPLEAFSVTKSFASTMVGIAEADGDLSLADPASTFIPQWKKHRFGGCDGQKPHQQRFRSILEPVFGLRPNVAGAIAPGSPSI